MFCASLRKRRDWAPAIPVFLKGEERKWQERLLTTHDVAVPLSNRSQQSPQELFRFVVLSASDLASPSETEQRIDRLYNLTGGSNVGLVFLLGEGGDMSGFMQLQLSILTKFHIPLIPVQAATALPKTINAFQQQLIVSLSGAPRHAATAAQPAVTRLLPYCALGSRLGEHAVNVLSDTNSGFCDLVTKAGSEDGNAELVHWLGADVAKRAIQFWTHEYTAK
ncbi:hypothetical protein NKR23_g511 [Pleurostoma richardsiae]|uniref:Uncharacterized protein n=1 Tax=Pleurostoma richardsiae TaxID=41990 RepID=A0AA38VYI9_9PEZI|nr:hypothetical protein NKR23_g511 [Pleurostoma richardsiae]